MALTLTRQDALTIITDDLLARYNEQIVDVDPDVTYSLRALRSSDVQRLRQPYITMRYDPKTHRQVENELQPDQAEALALDFLDHVLVAWTGVLDGADPAPCSRDYKAMLDMRRRTALLHIATTNTITRAEDRATSFRPPAGVGGVDAAQRGHHAVLPDGD